MTSRQRVLAALNHRVPDRVPVDFGGTMVTGIHVSVVAALRDYFGLEKRPVKALDPGQMLGLIEDDLKTAMGVDVEGVFRGTTRYGFPLADWKPFRMYDGLEILVPGLFNYTIDANGDTLVYPQGDLAAPPSARMPRDGYFFDAIIRQEPLDEGNLNPEDNLEEFGPLPEAELSHLAESARRARATGRAVIASFGGTSLGDIALIPGQALKRPRGIRDVTEWYMATRSRRDYVHRVFERQCEIGLANLARIHAVVGDNVDAVYVCGTDFGTQKSAFCSVSGFNELWLPYYKAINDWIHRNTTWKTFKHSCGSVARFYPSFIEAGFDIVNPVQCSAAGMDPEVLKSTFGDRLVFWGGGVDTQETLPFGAPAQVREQALSRLEIFARGGGYVFNTVHNIQAQTPVKNVVALLDAISVQSD
jgi:uroporphyrinogen-III decarboxylase